jgi:FecR protein
MNSTCSHWADLSDQHVLGESLSEVDQEFLRQHEQECAVCGREAALLRELRPNPLHAVPATEDVERILAQAALAAAGSSKRRSRSYIWFRRSTPWLAAAAGTLALAASIAFRLGGSSSRAGLDGAAATSKPLGKAQDDSCGALAEGVLVCLTAGTEVGRLELASTKRSLELASGRVLIALDRSSREGSFTVKTEAGDVVGAGAVFSVEVTPNQGAVTRVTHGAVSVRTPGAELERTVLAGQKQRLGETTASALSAHDAEQDSRLRSRWQKVARASSP